MQTTSGGQTWSHQTRRKATLFSAVENEQQIYVVRRSSTTPLSHRIHRDTAPILEFWQPTRPGSAVARSASAPNMFAQFLARRAMCLPRDDAPDAARAEHGSRQHTAPVNTLRQVGSGCKSRRKGGQEGRSTPPKHKMCPFSSTKRRKALCCGRVRHPP